MKAAQPQEQPPPVTGQAESQQGGEIRARWLWVEVRVWTRRMLKALETGTKESKWFRLIDKVHSEKNLQIALERVVSKGGSAGVDGRSVEAVGKQSAEEIAIMQRQLRAGEYQPSAVKRVWIDSLRSPLRGCLRQSVSLRSAPKPGSPEKRPLGVPTVRDRVMQTALRNVIEPIFERDFSAQSYGFRPQRGCKDALRQVDKLLKGGRKWVVDADIKGYFDTIPQDKLMELVERKIADGKVLRLIESYLKAGVMESAKDWQPTPKGTPQGAVISPLLANIYLDPLDWEMDQKGHQMVRYADDFVVLCDSEEEAKRALEQIQSFMERAGLTLHPEKTRIVEASQKGGFEFLGYHFERGKKWPRKKSLDKLKDKIRSKTKRTAGGSLPQLCRKLNPMLRGWYEYFKHGIPYTWPNIDGYVRGRLRSILRKRSGRKGRGRGSDHQRWPNAYFHAQGLLSLKQLYKADLRPR